MYFDFKDAITLLILFQLFIRLCEMISYLGSVESNALYLQFQESMGIAGCEYENLWNIMSKFSFSEMTET